MLNKERIYQIIDFVIAEAEGYETRVIVTSREEGLTRFANSEIHQNTFEDQTSVQITIQDGKKSSEISTTTYTEAGLKAAVQEAIANLEFLPEGELQIPLVETPALIEEDAFNVELDQTYGIQKRAQLVKEGIGMLEEGYIAYGALSYQIEHLAFGNSKQVKRFTRFNMVNFSVLIDSETGGSGYAEQISTAPEDLDVVGGFKRAYEKAKMNQNPIDVEPGGYTVILEPLAVGEVLTYLAYIGFSGKSVQDQRSFLTNKLGEKVFSEQITIQDDWNHEKVMKIPFDHEGYPRKQLKIIENGVAKELAYDTASAIKDQVETTGHSVNQQQMGGFPLHLVMEGGDQSLEEMIQNTKDGLLITRFHYMNVVNPRQASLTALTRDGVFKIEDGKIVGAVKNMRFTESMLQSFNNVVALSKEQENAPSFFGSFLVPAMKIENFHFTGKTDA